jgi:hypothetical protein
LHASLEGVCSRLNALAEAVSSTVPNDEPLNVTHGWNQFGVSKADMVDAARDLAAFIRSCEAADIGPNASRFGDYQRRLQYVQANTIAQIWGGNGPHAVAAYFGTLDALRRLATSSLKPSPGSEEEIATRVNRSLKRTRAIESRLQSLEPRTEKLDEQIQRINDAHEAADQLPEDLQSLCEARRAVADLAGKAVVDQGKALVAREAVDGIVVALKASSDEAAAVVGRCEAAYSAATSQGLARAFATRSSTLGSSMWVWVGGLVGALVVGAVYGTQQIARLAEMSRLPDVSAAAIVVNLLVAILSVGAPVWFAWLATKQIGERFRLAEDYAFKAAVSSAYEGYRREAARIDPDMEAQLLRSALTRLDEIPLRLVDSTSHGSPWHELMSSEAVRTAAKAVPGFVDAVSAMAKQSIAKLSTSTAEPKPAVETSPEKTQ